MLIYSGSDINTGVVKNTAEKRWGMKIIIYCILVLLVIITWPNGPFSITTSALSVTLAMPRLGLWLNVISEQAPTELCGGRHTLSFRTSIRRWPRDINHRTFQPDKMGWMEWKRDQRLRTFCHQKQIPGPSSQEKPARITPSDVATVFWGLRTCHLP
jgi:hypothetical protein